MKPKYCSKHPNEKMILLFNSYVCDVCDGIVRTTVPPPTTYRSVNNSNTHYSNSITPDFSYKSTIDKLTGFRHSSSLVMSKGSYVFDVKLEFSNWSAHNVIQKYGQTPLSTFIIEDSSTFLFEIKNFNVVSISNYYTNNVDVFGYADSVRIV